MLSLCLPQEGIKGSAWLPVSGRCADVAALARRGGARLGRARQPRRKRDEAAARGRLQQRGQRDGRRDRERARVRAVRRLARDVPRQRRDRVCAVRVAPAPRTS